MPDDGQPQGELSPACRKARELIDVHRSAPRDAVGVPGLYFGQGPNRLQ
jgi:hypothetical protein